MDKVRLGVIGCGHMAQVHLAALVDGPENVSEELRQWLPQIEVRGLADVNTEKAETYLQTYNAEYATADPEDLFKDPDIDAGLITTWHDTHGPFSVRAMDAGKHVLIEKPRAMTEQECDEILAAEERSGVKYMVAFRCRFAKGARDVKREIPHPDNIIAHARTGGIWPETIWAQDPIKGGGQILSQGCHVVDMMLYLSGSEPEAVYATGGVFHHSHPEVIDTINAAVRYKNGSVGAFMGGDGGVGGLLMHHPLPNNCPFWVMVVDKGRSGMAIDHGEDARFESCVPEDEWQPPYALCEYGEKLGKSVASGLPDILPSFAKSILTDEPPPATALDGAIATRFILRCFESARTGKIVEF